MKPFHDATMIMPSNHAIREMARISGQSFEAIRERYELEKRSARRVVKNNRYQVVIYDRDTTPGIPGGMIWLSIKRLDKQPIHDWRDLQRIKNALVGPENEAVELYPAESRLVDTANQYHLWVLKDPEARFPWGFNQRVVSSESGGGSVQRPIEPETL
jgi:hypothetical protein